MEKYKSGDILKVIVPNYPNNEEWLVITDCYTFYTELSKATCETIEREKLEAHVGIKLNSSSNPTIVLDWYIDNSFSSKNLNITFATQEEKNTLLNVLEQNKLHYIDTINTLFGNLDNYYKQDTEFNNTINYYKLPDINVGDLIRRIYSKTYYKVINITTRGIDVVYSDNKNNLIKLFIPLTQLTGFIPNRFEIINSFSSLNQSKNNLINTVNEYKKHLTI